MYTIQKALHWVAGWVFLLSTCTPTDTHINKKTDVSTLIRWNDIIMETAVAEDGLLTLKGVRTEAMTFAAIHDALNAIQPRYTPYSFNQEFSQADPVAASNQAAYEIAISQFPEQQDRFKEILNQALASIAASNAREKGIALGKMVARHLQNSRSGDQWNSEADYVWHPMAPGVYAEFNEHSQTPQGFIFGAGWARAVPFLLKSQDQFRSPPPPKINSPAYTQSFNEVKELGAQESHSRTQDQTHLAMWWKDFVENSHNRLARELVVKQELDLWETARVFALLNMVIFDAYVNVFDNKFHYNHWRPYTAIRWAAHDGNPDTQPDSTWNNLHQHTYAFPSYPSAHGCASTAAMTVLASTLGTGDEFTFTMTTAEVDQAGPFSPKVKMDPPTRSFNSFSEAGMEAAMSRLYLGIHFRYDSEEGYLLGKRIGEFAVEEYLTQLEDEMP